LLPSFWLAMSSVMKYSPYASVMVSDCELNTSSSSASPPKTTR
jgi:hypothetical protein